MTTVLNQFGAKVGDRIRQAFPDVTVIDIRGDDAAEGDVLFAVPMHGDVPLLDRLDELGVRWVQLGGTGVDTYPLERVRGRAVTCARGASAVPISEYVLAAMLSFEKHVPDVWISEPPEHWSIASLGTLDGKTLGLVGLGGIGAAVAERALPFGMRVVASRRRPEAGSPVPGVEVLPALDDVLSAADHLVVAAPATPRTRHLLDADALATVRAGVHLVNIARGSLIDQDALRAALDDGRVACATLDVTDPEPLPAEHWLYSHPSVRLTPHVSWSSPRMLDTIVEYFLANLGRWLRDEPLEGLVDIDEGY